MRLACSMFLFFVIASPISCVEKRNQATIEQTKSAEESLKDAQEVALAFRNNFKYQLDAANLLTASLDIHAFEAKVGPVRYDSGILHLKYNGVAYALYLGLISDDVKIACCRDAKLIVVAGPLTPSNDSFAGVTEAGDFPIYLVQGSGRTWSWCLVHGVAKEPDWPEKGGKEPTRRQLDERLANIGK